MHIYLVQLCTIVCNLKTYKSIHCIARNVHVSLVTFIASNLLLGLSYCSHADAMRFYIRWCNFHGFDIRTTGSTMNTMNISCYTV